MAQDTGLGSHQQPTLPLAQVRQQHREFHHELVTSLVRDAHTTPTSFRTGSNTLIPCKPLGMWRALAAAVGRRALPNRLCHAFMQALGAQRAALSFLPRLEDWQLLHATDERALQAEAAQFTCANGPSLSAALEVRPVLEHGLREDRCRSTPRLSEELPDTQQVLALPLHSRHRPIGVICLYYTQRTQLTDILVTHAQRAANLALEELLRWRPVHPSPACPRPVWTTDTRAARWERIHQAAELVAAREDSAAVNGLARLQEVSTREGLSLLDVADAFLQPAVAHQESLNAEGPRPLQALVSESA